MRPALLMLALLAGCGSPPGDSIPLYPGHVAKAQGRIMWFPTTPEFDETSETWRGHGAVEITSCIADPWPEGPGGKDAHMKVGERTSSYTNGTR